MGVVRAGEVECEFLGWAVEEGGGDGVETWMGEEDGEDGGRTGGKTGGGTDGGGGAERDGRGGGEWEEDLGEDFDGEVKKVERGSRHGGGAVSVCSAGGSWWRSSGQVLPVKLEVMMKDEGWLLKWGWLPYVRRKPPLPGYLLSHNGRRRHNLMNP